MMKKIFFIFALSGILAACTVGGGVLVLVVEVMV